MEFDLEDSKGKGVADVEDEIESILRKDDKKAAPLSSFGFFSRCATLSLSLSLSLSLCG